VTLTSEEISCFADPKLSSSSTNLAVAGVNAFGTGAGSFKSVKSHRPVLSNNNNNNNNNK
jgi:hypothetical protein